MKNKSLIVTITVVTALSLGILTGCGAYQQANADPLTNPTQIEQTIEIEDETETQDSTESTQETTQESSEATQETFTEQQELQNQDADPTEQSHSHNDNNDNKPNTTETTDSKPSTEQAHTHTWVTETRYRTVHHDAVYENKTIIDQAAWDETVVDQAAWDETVTTYTTETQTIHHDGDYTCRGCGAHFTTEDAINNHCTQDINCAFAGWTGSPGWDETVEVQVPHTETVHHDAVTHVVHHDAVTHTEKVLVTDAYDEQVPYTVEVCSGCHQDRK